MVTNIRLQQFRSYRDESFEFEPGVNIVVGPNGSGKTNLLEAVLVACSGGSYRVGDAELVMEGAEWARIDTQFESHMRTVKLQNESGRIKKSYVFDDKPYKILTFQHIYPAVLFEPNHLTLLHGQPEQRRVYMDALLEQLVPTYKTTRQHYRRVLSQRNALLKSVKRPSHDQLFVWNIRLSELGGEIARQRHEFITDIAKVLPGLYGDIADSESKNVTISYISKLPIERYETTLLRALEESYEKDVLRGFTSYGPHRDDFAVLFNGKPAEIIASRGETRTALLALKIHELALLESRRGVAPLLLLDDVFSELDGKRRYALTNHLKKYQTFITTTDADVVVQNFLDDCKVIPLSHPME